jgi:hypothetical protein
MGTTVWWMTAEQACEFYTLCNDLKLETEAERLALLDYMKQTGNVERAYTTGRDKEQVIKDLSKHYKAVLLKAKKQ